VQPVPDSSHVTPLPEESFRTVPVKVRVCPVGTGEEDGDIDTEMGMGVGVPLVISPPPHAVMTTDNKSRLMTAAILRIDDPPGWFGINQRGTWRPDYTPSNSRCNCSLVIDEQRNGKPRLLLRGTLLAKTGDFTNYSEKVLPGKVVGEMAIFRQLSHGS